MRRFLSLLLVLLLCVPVLPAGAELSLVYPEETVVSVIRLTKRQRSLAEYLYAPVLAGKEKIDLPKGTRYDDVGPAMSCLMLDYPELFHLGRTYTITYWQDKPHEAIAVTPDYRMDAKTANRLRDQLYAEALRIIRADSTPVGLHDAVVGRVTYGGNNDLRHTAVGALLYGTATCEGYAQALSLLYRLAGIPCGIISGTGVNSDGVPEGHSWNIAYLDGWTQIDATWCDQEGSGFNTRWYYGLSTAQMSADHFPGDDMDVPNCYDRASWHRTTGRYADDREDVFRALQQLAVYDMPLNLRITDAFLYRQIVADTGALMDAYNEWCPEGSEFYGRYTYLFSDAQRCIIIVRVE